MLITTNVLSSNCSRNLLTGQMPQNFADLPLLKSFDISYNSIAGDLSSISQSKLLTTLSLAYTDVVGDVSDLLELSNLEYLDLRGTNVTGDVSIIVDAFPRLQTCELSGSELLMEDGRDYGACSHRAHSSSAQTESATPLETTSTMSEGQITSSRPLETSLNLETSLSMKISWQNGFWWLSFLLYFHMNKHF